MDTAMQDDPTIRMDSLEALLGEQAVDCPYCGETISVLIDHSHPDGDWIEDCQVCCRPIRFDVVHDDLGEARLSTRHEDD
jgi:hypothetical protein